MTLLAESTRQRIGQLNPEEIRPIWRILPDSDPKNHLDCGYIPTGESCPACGRQLGDRLPARYSYQADVLADDHMTCMATGGEQAGKTDFLAQKGFSVIMAFLGEYEPSSRAAGETAWLVADAYEKTAQEFERLKGWIEATQMETDSTTQVNPGHICIKVKGRGPEPGWFTIKTRSANDPQSLRAESPIVTMVCEAALVTFDAYERLLTRVARARSVFPGFGAIIMSGTLEGSLGWYPTLVDKWRSPAVQEQENVSSFSLPSQSNIFAFKGGFQNAVLLEREQRVSEAVWKERTLAIPSPPSGRVHPTFDPTVHIQHTVYDPGQPILIGSFPLGTGTGCSGGLKLPTTVPTDGALCGFDLCGQFLVVCPSGQGAGLTNAVQFRVGR